MDLQGGIKLGPSLRTLVELNWTVTQFMQSLDGAWTELQFQVSQELELWTKFFWKGTDTALIIGLLLFQPSGSTIQTLSCGATVQQRDWPFATRARL